MEHFLKETEHLRANGGKLLLLFDGYGCHIQLSLLVQMRDAGVVIFAFPSHTSHVLQPLDVAVFGPFKCYIQKEVHKFARVKSVLDTFDVSVILFDALRQAFTAENIRSGFLRSISWNDELGGADAPQLEHILMKRDSANARLPTVSEIASTFKKMHVLFLMTHVSGKVLFVWIQPMMLT